MCSYGERASAEPGKQTEAHLDFATTLVDNPWSFLERLDTRVSQELNRGQGSPLVSANHSIPPAEHQTVCYGGGSAMLWVRFAPPGRGRLATIEGALRSALCQTFLEENVGPDEGLAPLGRAARR